MGYLLYVSHDAENLQFFLWLQDYTKRFHDISVSDRALSPPWPQEVVPQPRANESSLKSPDQKLHYGFDRMFDVPLRTMSGQVLGLGNTSPSGGIAAIQDDLKWQPCQFNQMTYPLTYSTNLEQSQFSPSGPK